MGIIKTIIIIIFIVACLVYPLIINAMFEIKYSSKGLEVIPIIMNTVALLVLLYWWDDNKYHTYAFIFAVAIYIITTYIVWKQASYCQCTIIDRVHKILANALIPVSIAFVIIVYILFLYSTYSQNGKRKKKK